MARFTITSSARRLALLIVFAFCIAAVLAGALILRSPRSNRGAALTEFAHAGQIRLALRAYADQHDGHFPLAWRDLPLDGVPPEAHYFRDPLTKKEENWLYYPGYQRGDFPLTILVASPRIVSSHQRIVVFSDTSAMLMEEAEFARRIAARKCPRTEFLAKGRQLPRVEFLEASLAEVAEVLRWPNAMSEEPRETQPVINIVIDDQAKRNLRINVSLNHVSVSDFLTDLSELYGIKVTYNSNAIVLTDPKRSEGGGGGVVERSPWPAPNQTPSP